MLIERSMDRVLFIAPGAIGDAVLASGLLRQFVEDEPAACFTIAGSRMSAPLFRDMPRLESLIAFQKRPYSLHWLDVWRRVRGQRWKFVVDMRGSGLAYGLWAKRRLIYRAHRPPAGSPPLHKVAEAARTIGFRDGIIPSPFLYTSAETEARADAALGSGGPLLAISPGASWPPKTWPSERFAEAAMELLESTASLSGGRVLLTGGPRDERYCAPVRRALRASRVVDVTGLDLLTVYACFRRVRLFIGNDSGPMHLSAAAGAPTLGLFGPSDPRRYRPWGPRTEFVRSQRDLSEYESIASREGYGVSHMTDLSVATVVGAAKALLARTGAREPDAAPPESASADA
jgi:ADP-heptose:LPS heptosyltransferase